MEYKKFNLNKVKYIFKNWSSIIPILINKLKLFIN